MADLVADFVAITSADPARAQQYLTVTDNNLEQAVQLYFESGGVDMGGAPEPVPQPPTGRGYSEDPRGVVHIDSDDEASEGVPPRAQPAVPSNLEDDEAMARRLQEEMYGGGEGGGIAGAPVPEDVRAPMARTTETLVGPDGGWDNNQDEMQAAITEQLMARRQGGRGRGGQPGIFNQRPSVWDAESVDPDSHRRQLSHATGGASDYSSKSSMLADMYRPPFDIMCRLPWDLARQEGKANEKWILVNVQDSAIFDCQVLNRDIWKNDQIKETVKENFLFMQYGKDDPHGNQYMQYYFPHRESQDAYPHIAIVDPRTGEQVKVWSGPPVPKPMDFLMQLHEFLDRYSLKAFSKNPVAKRKVEKKEKEVGMMTEEEMLEMAMKNSLGNNGSGPRHQDPDELTKSVNLGQARESSSAEAGAEEAGLTGIESPNGAAPSSAFARISSSNSHTEPAPDNTTSTRIQFRHPGGRVIRRFALADPVRRIYEWLKTEPLEGKQGVPFELVSMGGNLMDSIDSTIAETGLKNGTVMVEFVGGVEGQ